MSDPKYLALCELRALRDEAKAAASACHNKASHSQEFPSGIDPILSHAYAFDRRVAALDIAITAIDAGASLTAQLRDREAVNAGVAKTDVAMEQARGVPFAWVNAYEDGAGAQYYGYKTQSEADVNASRTRTRCIPVYTQPPAPALRYVEFDSMDSGVMRVTYCVGRYFVNSKEGESWNYGSVDDLLNGWISAIPHRAALEALAQPAPVTDAPRVSFADATTEQLLAELVARGEMKAPHVVGIACMHDDRVRNYWIHNDTEQEKTWAERQSSHYMRDAKGELFELTLGKKLPTTTEDGR